MSKIEHFPTWHAQVREQSEQHVLTATQSLPGDLPGTHYAVTNATELKTLALPEGALAHHNWAYTTRRVDRSRAKTLLSGEVAIQVGDLVLARIEVLGHHGNLQLIDGRRRRLFVGDLVVVAYGNRYACEQFEAELPASLSPCHLVAGGGVAARAISQHERISRGPTSIQPLGLLADAQGKRMNLNDFSLSAVATKYSNPTVFAVLGTAMDAGKTETAAQFLRGIKATGRRAGYIKITGTGAGGDNWLLHDAGADRVLDFTDAGLPSTYLAPLARIESAMELLINNMAAEGIGTVVMEVADGVYQRETEQLICSQTFARSVSGIVLAARDAMGASAGVQKLAQQSRPVLALSGLLSGSPLQRREAKANTGIRTFNREELSSPAIAAWLLSSVLANETLGEAP